MVRRWIIERPSIAPTRMKTRICLWYENRMGRNDGAGLYLLESLKGRPDVDVVHLVAEGDVREFGTFDLNIWIDHGEDSWITENFPCPKPNLYWVSDMHWSQQAKDFRI